MDETIDDADDFGSDFFIFYVTGAIILARTDIN
jgi:hypothetical protein